VALHRPLLCCVPRPHALFWHDWRWLFFFARKKAWRGWGVWVGVHVGHRERTGCAALGRSERRYASSPCSSLCLPFCLPVAPAQGAAMVTPFEIRALGWSDLQLPLEFLFAYVPSAAPEDVADLAQELQLTPSWQQIGRLGPVVLPAVRAPWSPPGFFLYGGGVCGLWVVVVCGLWRCVCVGGGG
jgi:hypothetical protein